MMMLFLKEKGIKAINSINLDETEKAKTKAIKALPINMMKS